MNKIPREIPPVPWYRQGPCQVFMAGFLPFSAIYIELHYIFASVWGHKLYTLYGILFNAFLMLIIVTSFITVALTYFHLAIEDHRWWWRSLFSGGSTGFFVFAYCFFYYFQRSGMFGFHADVLLLRLHADGELRRLHHARHRRLPLEPHLRTKDLLGDQVRLGREAGGAARARCRGDV